MVAVRAIDEIADPTNVIQRIHDDDGDDPRRLPGAVTRHFAALFLSPDDPDALLQVELPRHSSRQLIVRTRTAPASRCIPSSGIVHAWHPRALLRHDPGHLTSERNVSREAQQQQVRRLGNTAHT